jgi:Ca2+-binding EF-hand superfamily protein
MKKLFACAMILSLTAPLYAADKKADKPKPTPEELFKKADANGDGKVDLAEFKGKLDGDKAAKREEAFKKKDKNNDGSLDLAEFSAGGKKAK